MLDTFRLDKFIEDRGTDLWEMEGQGEVEHIHLKMISWQLLQLLSPELFVPALLFPDFASAGLQGQSIPILFPILSKMTHDVNFLVQACSTDIEE